MSSKRPVLWRISTGYMKNETSRISHNFATNSIVSLASDPREPLTLNEVSPRSNRVMLVRLYRHKNINKHPILAFFATLWLQATFRRRRGSKVRSQRAFRAFFPRMRRNLCKGGREYSSNTLLTSEIMANINCCSVYCVWPWGWRVYMTNAKGGGGSFLTYNQANIRRTREPQNSNDARYWL